MKELITRIEELAVQVAGAQLQIDKSEAESRELGRELGKARQKMMELVNERDHALARVPTESWAEENKRLAAQSEDLLGVLERRELLIKSLNDEITKRDHELRAHEKELAEQRLEREQMQHQISELRTECDRIREISKSLVPKSALMQAVQEAAELERQANGLSAEMNSLANQLMDAKAEASGIRGLASSWGCREGETVTAFIQRISMGLAEAKTDLAETIAGLNAKVAELETQAGKIGYVANGEHQEAVTAARENGIHKGESLSGFIWRQCEGLRKSQAENAPLSKLFVVLCKQRGNLNEEIIYRAVDEASDAIKKLTA